MKKNILIASYNLNYGGIEKSLITLLKNFNYDKYNVTLVLEDKSGVYLKEVPECVKILQYKVNNSKIILIRKIINMFKKILFNIKHHNKYDASICYATYSKPCSFIARTSSNNNILFVHSNYKCVYNEDISKIKEFFDNRYINEFYHIVFVSNESMNDLVDIYPEIKDKSSVINNLVDYESIIRLSKEQTGLKVKPYTFLFVGRLEEQAKKITRIIEVANKLKSNKDIVFWIIGDGPDKKEYESLIEKYNLTNVKLLGAKVNPYPYMKECNYLLLTSNYEGFPVVYNEAIVLNKPILTTIDVTDDFISIPNRFGIIMKKDIDDIYKSINKVIKEDIKTEEKVDFNKLNKSRISKLEELMEVK